MKLKSHFPFISATMSYLVKYFIIYNTPKFRRCQHLSSRSIHRDCIRCAVAKKKDSLRGRRLKGNQGKGVSFANCKFACIEGKCQMVTLKVKVFSFTNN